MSDAAQIIRLAAQRITLDAEWNEAQHKRDHGKFSSGGSDTVERSARNSQVAIKKLRAKYGNGMRVMSPADKAELARHKSVVASSKAAR